MSRSMVDRVALVLRAEGWVCDAMHEPVDRWGQCRDCDWLHRRTGRAIVDGVLWPAALSPYRPRLPKAPHEEVPGQIAIDEYDGLYCDALAAIDAVRGES